ncbi:hypothetical protein [Pseudactinotalea sp. Z1732]|uniref:hypothetical protein n=1 Tax=Micrococcales TaxID=85006 RepID=UPI003C7BAB3A
MTWISKNVSSLRHTAAMARQGLRLWTPRQFVFAAASAAAVALLIGIATVLIPNPIFGREIPPVWWNYPVWLLTSAFTGMLITTYLRPTPSVAGVAEGAGADPADASLTPRQERRNSRFGMVGTVLAWFAVGCPVCNKIALLALGYTGAITWFAPIQPFLALGALVLTGVALLWRLRGQVACAVPAPKATVSW